MALKDLVSRGDREESSFRTGIAAPPRTVAPPTSIDASTELTGNLSCSETVRIDGTLKGKLKCEKSVIIGQGGKELEPSLRRRITTRCSRPAYFQAGGYLW